jgi:hypothetical protein
MVQVERPRARRYPFIASIELTDLQSETSTQGQTSDLSLFGCHVERAKPLPSGARVRVRIAHKGEIFEAVGRVTNNQSKSGIGIVFTKIEENHQAVLEKWLAEVRDRAAKLS